MNKTRQCSIAFAAALLFAAWPVAADRGDQYVLGKLGIMSINKNDADALFSLGAVYGYGITPEVTAEAEVNLGLVGGEYKNSKNDDSGDYRIWTLAGYGVYRLPFSPVIYGKGKAGLLYENVTRSGEKTEATSSGLGLAGGIGAGFLLIENLTFEVEITGIDKDVVFYSLGMNYVFK